jgi:uncharacterized membrane protein
MTRNRALLLGLVLVIAAGAISAWAYPSLPPRVATHWNLAGQPNGYSSSLFAAILMPAVITLIWLLMLVLPAISPRGFRLEESSAPFYISTLAIMVMMLVLHVGILRVQLSGSAPSGSLFIVPIGLLFIVLGGLMAKLKKNFWIGIRTPWTLASDEVWLRTNRLGGTLFIIGGVALVAASLFGRAVGPLVLGVIAVVVVVPIAYSYVLYRRIEGFGENEI